MCALKKDLNSSTGILVKDAYIKVDDYSSFKNNIVVARLRAYVSKELSEQGASPIEGSEDIINLFVDYEDSAENPKKQIYKYAKTLEKYENAIDC